MSFTALDYIEMALKSLRGGNEFEKYELKEDIKESWIDDLETIKEILASKQKAKINEC